MIYGFSGTSTGLTDAQVVTVRRLFLEGFLSVLHHGDCVGGDAQAHLIADNLNARIIGHPPINDKKRAHCVCSALRAPLPYLDRNREIVAESRDGLITAPRGVVEQYRGSGTWATIRYTRRARRPLWIVWPDGTHTYEA